MVFGFTNRRLIRIFKRSAKAHGIRVASRHVLELLGVSLTVDGSFLKTGSQLVISNHVTVVDIFKMLASIPRDDVYIVSFSLNKVLGHEFSKRLLPIYVSNKEGENIFMRLRLLYWTMKEGNISRQETMRRNRETISQASKLVSQGNTVIIFPSGFSALHKNKWLDGVGYLAKEITDPHASVVFVKMSGRGVPELLRYRSARLIRWLLPTAYAHMRVARPISVNRFRSLPDGKAITRQLHDAYTAWSGNSE